MKTPKAKKLPSGSWNCSVMVGGKRYSFTRDTKKEAEQAAAMFKMRPDQKITRLTLREGIDQYIESRSNVLSPSTIKGYRDIQRQRFQTVMDCHLSQRVDWQAVINLEAKKISPKTLKNSYALIAAVYRENGIILDRVQFPQAPKEERPFLDPDQIKVFVKAIEGDQYELAYLLCLHGLRRSEMLALRKDQVKGGVIHVRGALVKGVDGFTYKDTNKNASSTRDVPIMTDRVPFLVAQSFDGLLCPYSASGMSTHLRTICKHNDLPRLSLHCLRHSFVSLCYYRGISELACMSLGGYSDFATMRRIYTHLSKQEAQAAADNLKEFFRA